MRDATPAIVFFVVLALGWSRPVDAQPIQTAFDQLSGHVKPGQVVLVIDRSGQETRGHFVGASSSTLTLTPFTVDRSVPSRPVTTMFANRGFAREDVGAVMTIEDNGSVTQQIYRAPWALPIFKPGRKLRVLTTTGNLVTGRVVTSSLSVIEFRLSDRVESFQAADIGRIDEPRGRHSGKIGALVGLGLGTLQAGALCSAGCGEDIQFGGLVFFLGGLYAGIGAATGVLVDTAHPAYRPVYASRARASVTVAPMVSGRRRGMAVTVTW